jgi:hypothetical protein
MNHSKCLLSYLLPQYECSAVQDKRQCLSIRVLCIVGVLESPGFDLFLRDKLP